MSRRPDRVCPFHAGDRPEAEHIGNETVDWQFTCEYNDHPVPGPYVWSVTDEPGMDMGQALGLDLGSTLPKAVRDASQAHGGGWVEYGLVERAFALANPEDWSLLLARYDHRWFGQGTATQQELPYTASRYLAGRLGDLSRRGDVRYRDGKGTGYWSYLRRVSHWAPAGSGELSAMASFGTETVAMDDYMPAKRPV